MFERLNVAEIRGMGFIIMELVRHPIYKAPSLLNEWSGIEFEGILKAIKSHLSEDSGIKGANDGSNSRSPNSSISKTKSMVCDTRSHQHKGQKFKMV